MPQWRKLHVKATESLDIDEMPNDFYRLLWVMLPLGLDSEGRGLNNPAWIKAKIMPLRTDVKEAKIKAAMDWYEQRGMIEKYEIDERSYFWIPTFEQYQGNTSREAPSDYPPPPFTSKSRVSHDLLTSKSRVSHDQVKPIESLVGVEEKAVEPIESYSRVAHDLLTSKSSTDSDVDVDSETDSERTTTTVAAVKILLSDFGVEEPELSDLASMCSEQDVKDWIAYVNGRDGINNPTGFLISRLRVGESAPEEKWVHREHWFTDEERKQFFVQPGELPELDD